MSKSPARMQLGFSPLSKTIQLAKMRDVDGGRVRVGNDPGQDARGPWALLCPAVTDLALFEWMKAKK